MNVSKFVNLIGETPLVHLDSFMESGSPPIYAKCEFLNPGFSMKDRIAKYILDMAERKGQLKSGDTIVCASSGNTGCSVAMLGAVRGYSVIIVTSKKCSLEKQNHIKALNARLIVVDDDQDYMEYGNRLACEHGYFNVDQYNNPYNPEAYYKTLGPEIWRNTQGKITHFVMTGSTFGCISGTARFLKEKNSNIRIILADPASSNIYAYYYNCNLTQEDIQSSSYDSPSIIEGAGKKQPTQCLDFSVIDEVIQISDKEAILNCHQLAKQEGLLVGGSSGINVAASRIIANSLDSKNMVVTVLCDSGIKYLSKIYNSAFLLNLFGDRNETKLHSHIKD